MEEKLERGCVCLKKTEIYSLDKVILTIGQFLVTTCILEQ